MPPGMHSNMDAAGKQQDVSRCEEDERTMSMLNLKDQAGELRSLYRTREDEEVVFERSGEATKTDKGDDDDDDDAIRRGLSNSTVSNATSTSSASVMNAWDHGGVRDEKKEEELLMMARRNQTKEQQERAAATSTPTTSREVDRDDNKKLIKRVNPASLSPKSQQATSPSSQSSGSPPPLVSPGQQEQLFALARRKVGQHKVIPTNHGSNVTTAQKELKAPPGETGIDLAREERIMRNHPSPERYQMVVHIEQEGGVASLPKPGTLKSPPHSKMDQGPEAASLPPPNLRMDVNQDHYATVASPSGSRHSNTATSPKRPSLASAANSNQDHVASPSGSRHSNSNTASPKRPSLASCANSNTMGLTRQGGAHSLVSLKKQGGVHDLKPEQLPVQDNVPGFQSMHPHHNPQHPMPTRRAHQQGYSGGGSIASSDAQSRGASIGGRTGPATRPGIRNKIAAFGQRRKVDEKTKQLAAELNKQKRMKQKLQMQQPPIVAKVPFKKERRISDASLDMESVGTGGARRRRSSVSEVHNDPVFNTVVSEPENPFAPRSALTSQKIEQHLAVPVVRRGLNRNHSPQVMQNTPAISHRTGLSSLTGDSAAVQEAAVKMQGRPGLVITLDNLATSTHSSVGFNSASNRTLDVSAHLNASWPAPAKVPNSYHNYHSELQPHLEGGSVSSNKGSRTAALDATSVVSPPTRDEFHRRRSSVRVPPDSASVASSRVSGVGAPRRRSRTSFTGAGLKYGRPSIGEANEPVRRSSKPGEAPIRSRTGMDAARYHIAQQMKQESEKKTIEDWDDMLKFQDDVIIELACKLSKLDNEKQVQAQQQLHLHAGKGPATTAPSAATALSDLTQYHHYHPDHGHGFVEENSQAIAPNESMQTAEYQAMLIAFEESQKDSHPKPELELEDDKALKIALEKSLIEAQESDKVRNARQLYSDLEDSFPEIEPEKSAPWAPMEEGNVAQPSDAEVEKTMEVAKKLSIETHEFEISKKHAPPMEKNVHHVESCHSPRTGRNTLDSALQMEYSVSTQNDGPPRSPNNVGNGANDHEPTPNHSLVMPSELIEDDESVHRETLSPQTPTVNRSGDDGEEALLLAMALSKMEVAAANPNANVLSEDESLAFALAESRRTPGAHGSMGSSDSLQRPPTRPRQSSTDSFQDQFDTQDVYQGTQAPQYQFPHGLPFHQQGYHQPPHYPPQQFHPQMYPPQPYYAPPYQPPMYQPPPYQMPPYQPHLYPPQGYQAPAYPQFYHPPYHQPYSLPYQQPHYESQNVSRSNPSASAGYFDSSPAAMSPHNTAEPEDDEAFKLALALSREDARDANNRKRGTITSNGSKSVPLVAADDDGSLALALELSRMK